MFKFSLSSLLVLISLSACSSKVAQIDREECHGTQCYAMIKIPSPSKNLIEGEGWKGI